MSATLQDILRRYKTAEYGSRKLVRVDFKNLPNKVRYFPEYCIIAN